MNLWSWLLPSMISLLLFIITKKFVHAVVFSPLNQFPGTILARFTNLWRLWVVFTGHAHLTHTRLHRTFGSAVLLGPNFVSLDDPDHIRTIYGDERFVKSDFYTVADSQSDRGERIPNIFSTTDPAFHSREIRTLGLHYSVNNTRRFEPVVDRTIVKVVDILDQRSSVCDLGQWLKLFAWDAIAEITFGAPLGFLDEGKDVYNLIKSNQKAIRYFALVGQVPRLDHVLRKLPLCRSGSAFAYAVQFSIERIRDRSAVSISQGSQENGNLLDMFIGSQKPSNQNQNQLVSQLLASVVAGADTTASTLISVVYFVLKHGSVLETLRGELDRKALDMPAAFDQVHNLPYLKAVVNETMRLQPAVGLTLERVVPEGGFTLPDGRTIPEGSIVGMNPYVIHRNEKVFGRDPDVFRPERWLRQESEDEVAFNQRVSRMMQCNLTFGYGKRICIGRHVSSLEIYKMVATLFYLYDISLIHPMQNCGVQNYWFVDVSGLVVNVCRRRA